MKKLFKPVLALMMAFFLVTMTAFAVVYSEGPLYYTVEDESITITGYFGRDSEVTVPAMIAGIPVNTIGAGAFIGTAAKRVNLPDSIMTVEEGAVAADVTLVYRSNLPDAQEVGGGTTQPASDPGHGTTPSDPTAPEQPSVPPAGETPGNAAGQSGDSPLTEEPIGSEIELNADAIEQAREDDGSKAQAEKSDIRPIFYIVVALAVLIAAVLLFKRRKAEE